MCATVDYIQYWLAVQTIGFKIDAHVKRSAIATQHQQLVSFQPTCIAIRKLWMLKRRGHLQHQSMGQSHASMSIQKRCSMCKLQAVYSNSRPSLYDLNQCRRRTFGSHWSICLRKKKNFQWLHLRFHGIDAMGMQML